MRRSLLVVLVLLSACSAGERDSKSKAKELSPDADDRLLTPVKQPEEDLTLSKHMDQHFAHAQTLQAAVIEGDLEGAKAAASWLVDNRAGGGPASWEPHLTAMTKSAVQVQDASDVAGVARASAEMLSHCGACHSAHDTGPEFAEPPRPNSGHDPAAHMQRHRWAADRLQEGLVQPSEDRWMSGAKALAETPLEPCDVDQGDILPDDVVELRKAVHSLGTEAGGAETVGARVGVYGKLLETCAGCHRGGC